MKSRKIASAVAAVAAVVTGAVLPVVGPAAGSEASMAASATLAAAAGKQNIDVFFTPHQDDETLSMGVLILERVRAGDDVWVVNYTTTPMVVAAGCVGQSTASALPTIGFMVSPG